ncbi:MAG: ATP-binding protein [Azoarcus sp.]|nr:ATP-binding protein [Azoarcus sp.]
MSARTELEPLARWHGLRLPRSLRLQFVLALSALALLIVAGAVTAVLALRVSADATRNLAAERLVRMQDAQDLVQRTVLIERESEQLLAAESLDSVRSGYSQIVDQLDALDHLVGRLGAASSEVSVLALHQSGQLFRNTAHVVAQLRERSLQANTSFDRALKERTESLAASADPAAMALLTFFYPLPAEHLPREIEGLRDQFVLRAAAVHDLPAVVRDDLEALRPGAEDSAGGSSERGDPFSLRLHLLEQEGALGRFRSELRRQAIAMASSAQAQSARFTDEYRTAVLDLAKTSRTNERRVLALLAGSLILAWLVSRHFLGRQVMTRLQQVSHYLRSGEAGQKNQQVPVHGSDEIADMARAVEQFLRDRQRLAEANVALEAERARQDALISKLAEARSQLLQSEKLASIGQLAAGVAHEINTPIGFVSSNLGSLQRYVDELLRALSAYEVCEGELSAETRTRIADLKRTMDLGYLKEDVRSLIAESAEGLQTVKHIVQDLRDFANVDDADKQWANLERGLDSALNVASSELRAKGEVVREYAGIPEIECIAPQLNQVFMNLLMNAAYAIEGHGRITVRTGTDGDAVWVEVEDTGCGIHPEHLDRIFDPFFTTRPVGKGSGLGLSLSYGIVARHGGRIEVRSNLGAGSVFRVVLPIRSGEAQAAGKDS